MACIILCIIPLWINSLYARKDEEGMLEKKRERKGGKTRTVMKKIAKDRKRLEKGRKASLYKRETMKNKEKEILKKAMARKAIN